MFTEYSVEFDEEIGKQAAVTGLLSLKVIYRFIKTACSSYCIGIPEVIIMNSFMLWWTD